MAENFVFDWGLDPFTVVYVPTKRIDLDKDNGRGPRVSWDEAAYQEIKASIEKDGMQEPIVLIPGRNGQAIVASGNRRFYAARELGMATVPCFLNGKKLSKAELLKLRLRDERFQSKWPPTGRAEKFAEAIALQGSVAKAASWLGISQTLLKNAQRLLKLPKPIKTEIDAGRIDATAGYLLARMDDVAEQKQAAIDIIAGRLSVAQLRNRLERGEPNGERRHRRIFDGGGDIGVSVTWGLRKPSKSQLRKALERAISELDASE